MNTVAAPLIEIPTIPGTPFAGGFYVGRIRIDDAIHALIVAGKDGEIADSPWNKSLKNVAGAESYCDGLANTQVMAKAGSALAEQILALQIGGETDWYLPSRDELELCYRNLKPGTEENYCYRHGENPSAVPPAYPYTPESPDQTTAEQFCTGGAAAFDEVWYWTSTQCAPNPGYAWLQDFENGHQLNAPKCNHYRARAVRRLIIR